MDETLISMISSVGFPIVMCFILVHKMEKQDSIYRESEEKLRAIIEKNTLAINTLAERLGGEKK